MRFAVFLVASPGHRITSLQSESAAETSADFGSKTHCALGWHFGEGKDSYTPKGGRETREDIARSARECSCHLLDLMADRYLGKQ